jgi:hypothetical protein
MLSAIILAIPPVLIGVWWGRRMAYARVRAILDEYIDARYNWGDEPDPDWRMAKLHRYDAAQALHEQIFGEMKPPKAS